MRSTFVYVLHVLIDDDEPGTLRGVLRSVATGEEHAFSNEAGLVELLQSLTATRQVEIENNQSLSQRGDV